MAQSTKTFLLPLVELYRSGQFSRVIDTASELIRENPKVVQLYTLRGASLVNQGKFEDAIPDFRTALQLNTTEVSALEFMGICCEQLGRFDEAALYFKRSLPPNPHLLQSRRLAQVTLTVGDEATARTSFNLICDALLKKRNYLHHVVISRCLSPSDWSEMDGVQILDVAPAQDVHLTSATGDLLKPYKAEALRFAKIPEARAVIGWDFVISSTGEVLNRSGYADVGGGGEFSFIPHVSDKSNNKVIHIWSDKAERVGEDVIFLSVPEKYHFGHWVIDFLPRLMAMQCAEGKPLKILMPSSLPQHHRDTLALFGLHPENFIEGEIGACFQFKSLFVFLGSEKDRLHPDWAMFLYDALAPCKVSALNGDAENRFFLHRTGERRGRFFANQSELNKVFTEFGVETVRRPEISIFEQNEKFKTAGIVLSAFGTDLVTVFQLRPGTDLVVFCIEDMLSIEGDMVGRNIDVADIYLDQLCAIIGIRVHRIYCKSMNNRSGYAYLQDMQADCEEVRQKLEQIVDIRTKMLEKARAEDVD